MKGLDPLDVAENGTVVADAACGDGTFLVCRDGVVAYLEDSSFNKIDDIGNRTDIEMKFCCFGHREDVSSDFYQVKKFSN